MSKRWLHLAGGFIAAAALCLMLSPGRGASASSPDEDKPAEKHLKNLRQLTFGGENAEAYFSADNRWLIFQAHQGDEACDQMYIMDTEGNHRRQLSNGKGRTTCGYFFPDGKRVLYSSTFLSSPSCPPKPDYSHGYVWQVNEGYDIFSAKFDGSNLKRLTSTPGYDAEATISRDGKKIVFTSMRDGDLDIYSMDADGKNVRRLTTEIGYDGGPWFSPDGKHIVYRAYHPTSPKDIEEYRSLLKQGLVHPTQLEIFVMDADGSNKRQVTHMNAASFAPEYFPDGKRIIFSSNQADPRGRTFELFMINTDGSGLERITFDSGFASFPMFSSDGKHLVFSSMRNGKNPGDINIFIADWVN